jgi:hypothetical protein
MAWRAGCGGVRRVEAPEVQEDVVGIHQDMMDVAAWAAVP